MFAANQRRLRAVLFLIVVVLLSATAACPSGFAHEGPPFPILMDKPLAGKVVSVWADPDIGEARFFIVVESPSGEIPQDVASVSMWFEPVNGRLERATCEGKSQSLKNQLQFEANPYFDQRDTWNIGFRLTAANGVSEELTEQIESTPPGFGLWDFAIYLFPFFLIGGMWVLAMMRRRHIKALEVKNTEAKCDAGGTNSTQSC